MAGKALRLRTFSDQLGFDVFLYYSADDEETVQILVPSGYDLNDHVDADTITLAVADALQVGTDYAHR